MCFFSCYIDFSITAALLVLPGFITVLFLLITVELGAFIFIKSDNESAFMVGGLKYDS